MNQSGIQKTLGAMLLASGATLVIVILGGEAIRSLKGTGFTYSPKNETTGKPAWDVAHSQPTPSPSQNNYVAKSGNSLPQQTNPINSGPTFGQSSQVSYVADSNFGAESRPQQPSGHSLQNQTYEVTNYPSITYSELPQPTPQQADPNQSAVPRRAVPSYPPPQRLARVEGHVQLQASPVPAVTTEPAITLEPAIQPAEPTLAQRPSNETSDHSARAEFAQEHSEQESSESFSVLQTNFETRILKPDSRLSAPHLTSQIRIDKQGLKISEDTVDSEALVELVPEPSAKAAPALSSVQPSALPRRRAHPQAEASARKRIQYGESLSRRRSFYAAREEFILALLLVSNSHENESTHDTRADRLAQALTAMDEISDFASMRNRSGNDPRFQQAVDSHKTQLLAGSNLAAISPKKAIDLYCGYAQSQLEQAIGLSAAGSEALHALGKLELMAPNTNSRHASIGQTKALVFFRSSMSVNRSNALCANDLGVLLFNMGRLNEAEEAFRLSLGSTQSRLVWNNLTSVHRQQASLATSANQRNHQLQLAQAAGQEAQKLQNNPRDQGLSTNEWATTSDFQNNAAFPDTAAHRASGSSDDESPLADGVRVRAVSFLQKITGGN